MTANRLASPDIDPQCPFLMQRIDELRTYLFTESDATRAQPSRLQLRALLERARCLGCFDTARVGQECGSLQR